MMSNLFTPPPEDERGASPLAFILFFGVMAVLISFCV